jgi:Ca2+-binding RTX toxin-like protein
MQNTINTFHVTKRVSAKLTMALTATGLALLLTATAGLRAQETGAGPEARVGAAMLRPVTQVEAAAPDQGGIAWLHADAATMRVDGSDQPELIDGSAADDVLRGQGGGDHIFGAGGNDTVIGGAGDDVLAGGTGNDKLIGRAGADTLEGGAGDDVLEGGEGDDTYVFDGAFGHDVVRERAPDHSGSDQLAFTQLRKADVRIEQAGADLIVTAPSGDSVRIEGFFSAGHQRVETLRFVGGEVASLDGLHPVPQMLAFAGN